MYDKSRNAAEASPGARGKSGKLAGIALDVYEAEPCTGSELFSLPGVLCTPHLGASTEEAQTQVAVEAVQLLIRFLTAGEIRHAVNMAAVDRGAGWFLRVQAKDGGFAYHPQENNTEHLHSSLRFVTPDDRHFGREDNILLNRHHVYEKARRKNPIRWTKNLRNWEPVGDVCLNPKQQQEGHLKKAA